MKDKIEMCWNKDEFKNLTEKEVRFNIKKREELIGDMVGSLYPSILENEISLLNECLEHIKMRKDAIWHKQLNISKKHYL